MMMLDEALATLRSWCEQSAGTPIEIAPGHSLGFLSQMVYGELAIQGIEERLRCSLPEGYRRFMATIGESALFSSHYGGGVRFFSPERVIEASLEAVPDGIHDRDRFCFVGEHRSMGDFMGFLIGRPGPNNYDVFCHEYPLEEYVAVSDELASWRTFDDWVIRAVESHGEDTL